MHAHVLWLKTTKDHEKGVHQKVSNYSDGLKRNFKLYSKEQENYNAIQCESNLQLSLGSKKSPVVGYPYCTGSSLCQKFVKTISPFCIKYKSVLVITTNNKPKYVSGGVIQNCTTNA
jgi:hypothetical protein